MSNNSKDSQNIEAAAKDKGVVVVSSKPTSKCVRICTVCAYLFAVSSAAIMLSLYYLFIWDPQIHE